MLSNYEKGLKQQRESTNSVRSSWSLEYPKGSGFYIYGAVYNGVEILQIADYAGSFSVIGYTKSLAVAKRRINKLLRG